MTREVALTQALATILDGDEDAAAAAAMDPDGLALAMVDRRAAHVRASEARRFARMVWESMGVRS